MRKEQADLEKSLVHIADSKRANGIGDMPLTDPLERRSGGRWRKRRGGVSVPSKAKACKPHMTNLRKVWTTTLKKAGVPYFAPYELRHTFAPRLSAGGVADHTVTQMLRQGAAEVLKVYSQAKLGMMREAPAKLDRQANERAISSTQMVN